MAFTSGRDNRGQSYRIDWEQVSNIVGAHAYLRAFVAHARQGDEANLLGSVKTVEFDHKKVRASKQRFINATVPMVVQAVQADYVRGQQVLLTLRNQTLHYRKRRDELFATAEASGKTMDWWADKAIGGAQLVRDTGFAAVAVIGAPVVGGWAIGFSVVGAAAGKYQDTGNVGSALVSGAGSLLMAGWGSVVQGAGTLVNGTRVFAPGIKGIMLGMGIVIDTTMDTVGGVLEGKNGADLARGAMMKILTGGLGAGLDHAMAKKVDAITDQFSKLTQYVGWRDAATLATIEAAKQGTGKVAGAVLDQASAADAAAAQTYAAEIKQRVLKGG